MRPIRKYTKNGSVSRDNTAQRGVKIDGLSVPDKPTDAGDETMRLQGSEIPLLKRFDLADEIYKKQFVIPLLEFRAKDVYDEFQESAEAKELQSHGIDTEKTTPRTLEMLFHYDKNKMLKACANAYIELIAKTRKIEIDLKNNKLTPDKATSGSFKWYQNDVSKEGKGKLVEIDSKLSAEGMMQFIEYASQLISEATLFASEAYFTQGGAFGYSQEIESTMDEELLLQFSWPNFTDFHRLQYFNEQIGEGLKEMRTRLRRMKDKQDIDDILQERLKKEEESENNKEDPDLVEDTFDAYMNSLENMIEIYGGRNDERRTTLDDNYGKAHSVGRALKHIILFMEGKELRDGEEVELDKPYQVIKNRIKEYQQLFPYTVSPDELDIEALKIDYRLAMVFEEFLGKLKAIAQGAIWENHDKSEKEDYSNLTDKEREQKLIELVETAVNEDKGLGKFAYDSDRAETELKYDEAAPNSDTTKYNPPSVSEATHVWGLRHLTHHLLWHAAAVNNKVRTILSRGPVSMTVKNIGQ